MSGKTSRKREPGRALAEVAYDQIKAGIIRCELEPGRQVTEEQLASRFGVGRAAVRAALKRLYQERLVQLASRQRYLIAPITLKYVHDLFEIRFLLEPAAAKLAAGRLNPSQKQRLRELSESQYVLGDPKSAEEFLCHNTEFHGIVAQASGNDELAAVIVGLLDKIERVHHLGHLLRDRNEEAFHEHHDLLDALIEGEGERAEAIMREQIAAARGFVIDTMITSPSVQSVNVAATH